MAGGSGAIKAALWAVLVFAFASWVLALVGIAGVQRQCYFQPPLGTIYGGNQGAGGGGISTGGEGVFASDLPVVGIRGLNRSYSCTRLYGYYWFMIAMQIVSLLGLSVLSCIGLLAASGLSWMAWFTVLSLLFIQGSDTFLALQDIGTGLYGYTYRYARLTSAGWILTAISNLAIIFLLGWRPRRSGSRSGPMKY